MRKTHLREIISDQKLLLAKVVSNSIPRTNFSKIEASLHSDHIVIITGIRRCGKSTLMQQIREMSAEHDYFMNFDDERLVQFQLEDFQTLYELFIELYGKQTHFYFDEIQNIPGWEKFIRRLHDYGHKIIITGSNANLLSRELGTHLTGRYIQHELFPFSFAEYLTYQNILIDDLYSTEMKGTLQGQFQRYLRKGGIPEYLKYENADYLSDLYEGILYRDIVARYHLNKTAALKELVYLVSSNIGKQINFVKLQRLLGLGSSTTVKDYLSYFHSSYLIFTVAKFDYSLKKQLIANKKIYMIDNALAEALGFRFSSDHGRLLENLIYIELLRNNYEVFYHNERQECDFILRKQGKITAAIQVCSSLENADTKAREIAGLIEALVAYKLKQGLIITEDEEDELQINQDNEDFKIRVIPAWKWLLEGNT